MNKINENFGSQVMPWILRKVILSVLSVSIIRIAFLSYNDFFQWYECVPPDPQDPTKYGPCPGKPVGYKPKKFLWIYTPRNECRKELSCSGNQVEGTFLTYEDCVNKLDNSKPGSTQQQNIYVCWLWHVARIISSQKIYGLYGLKHQTVEMRRCHYAVCGTDNERTNNWR